MKNLLTKNYWAMKGMVLLVLVVMGGGVKGQISEDFQTWTSKNTYIAALSQTGSGGTWTALAGAVIVSPGGAANGSGSVGFVQIASGSSYSLFLPTISSGGVGNVTLQVRASSASAASFTVDKNVNGGGWTTVTSFTSLTINGVQYQSTLNDASSNIQIRITNSSSTRTLYIHDIVTTSYSVPATNYYSKSTGDLSDVSNWGNATDGSGTAPTDFTSANQVFNIRNNATPTIGAAWTVSGSNSKIVVGDGTNACNFTIPASYALTGTVDVSAGATLTNTNTANPTLGTINATSTIIFNAAGSQNVPLATYGNLSISNTGGSTATAAGAISITNAMTVSSGSTFDMSTFSLSGATLNTSGTGTLKTQNTTSTPLPTGRTWSMDVLYNSASGQTVVVGTYANLNLTGGNRTLIASGTINISGTYTPGVGTFTVTSNTINFNGTDGQTIPAGTYNILTSSNNTRTLANGVIKIASTFTPGSSNYTIGTSTVEFNGSSAQTIPVLSVASGGNYYNLTYSGSSTGTLAGSMTVAGNFVQSAGTFQITSSSVSSAITINVTGNATLSNAAILKLLNSTTNGAAATVTVTGNTTTSGTSSINLESVDNTNASGKGIFQTIDFTTTSTSTSIVDFGATTVTGNEFRISGNFSKSGIGKFNTSSTSSSTGFVFNKSGTQTFSYSGDNSTFTQYVINSGSTLQLSTSLTMGAGTNPTSSFTVNGTLDMGTNVISGTSNPTFTLGATGAIITSNTGGLVTAITTPGINVFTAGASYTFNGATITPFHSATLGAPNNVTINANVTMNKVATISGTLTLTSGILNNSTNNITLSNGATISRAAGSLSATPVFGSLSTHRVNVNITGSVTSGNELLGTTGGVGTLTINNNNTYTLGANQTIDALSIGAGSTLDAATYIITPRASGTVTINGTLKTSNLLGFSGNTTTTINNTNAPTVTIGGASTIEYTASSGSQLVSNRSDYFNLNTSGAGTKTLDGNTTVGGTLSLSSKLAIDANTLTLAGAFSGSATNSLTGISSSNLSVSGTTGTLYFDQTTPGTTNVFKNLTISGSGTTTLGNTLNITAGTIAGTVSVATGATLATGGNLIIKSDVNGTASIGNSAGTITGNITVERYIPALRKFRFLAAPVVGATAANWRNNGTNTVGIGTHITGGVGNNFDQSTTNAASAFSYNELLAGSDVTVGSGATSDPGWTAFADGNSEALTNGKGFRILVRGDRTISLDGSGSTTPTNTTLSVTGTYPANSVSIATTKTNSNTNSGFNLVGNPYPATIDWNLVTKGADISATYTIYDPTSNSYKSWNGSSGAASQYIASGQAFFVQQQTGTTSSITIDESDKVTNAAGNYFRNKLADHLKLSMIYDSANYDAAFIHFRTDAQNDFDNYDGLKFQNAGVNIASVGIDGKRYNINSLASLTKTTEMPISILGSVLTNYELKFEDVQSFKNHELYLIDTYLNKMLLLSDGFTYPITLSSDSASVKDGRLKIVFVQKATGINLNEKNANAFILYPNPAANAIHLLLDAKNTINENVAFEICNQLGAIIQFGNLDFTSAKDQEINIENLAQGSYFIKLHGQTKNQTIKFIK